MKSVLPGCLVDSFCYTEVKRGVILLYWRNHVDQTTLVYYINAYDDAVMGSLV